jgi:hypothetical protein
MDPRAPKNGYVHASGNSTTPWEMFSILYRSLSTCPGTESVGVLIPPRSFPTYGGSVCATRSIWLIPNRQIQGVGCYSASLTVWKSYKAQQLLISSSTSSERYRAVRDNSKRSCQTIRFRPISIVVDIALTIWKGVCQHSLY